MPLPSTYSQHNCKFCRIVIIEDMFCGFIKHQYLQYQEWDWFVKEKPQPKHYPSI